MADELRLSGFKRILARLDDGTRRKYCGRALAEDLEATKREMDACVAAMTQAKQVQDATRRLERASVSEELLVALETLLGQLDTAATTLGGSMPQTRNLNLAQKPQDAVKEEDLTQEAKTLVKQILQNGKAHDAVARIRKLEKLMPVLAEVGEKTKKWWTKHVQKVVSHGLELLKGEKNMTSHVRLGRSTKRMAAKCPELQDWHKDVEKQLTKMKEPETAAPSAATVAPSTKSKKKRAIPLPDDGESALVNSKPTKSAKTTGDVGKEKKSESVEKARSLLTRCSREVRTLRDKFELGAYDVNLSRMVTIVDALWSGIEQAEVISLTTALFTLVETVEKVARVDKRRDRLVCLESVLGVALGSPKLKLPTRRKTMVEEYAYNCRQSLQQLNRQLNAVDAAELTATEQTAAEPTAAPTATTKAASTARAKEGAWPKSHVRFA